ncbi:MAG: glycosyltransferase family 39 protein [Candidatus Omnitrophica bacterium]|nr:glycosyltransferase family 39 protein [Candidatus Omnitrophota bacterium]
MNKPVLWILFTALFLRLLLFAVIMSNNQERFMQPDSYGYVQIAENIVSHKVYSGSYSQPFLPEHSRTPVYPFFIAMLKFFHMGVTSVILFQIILSSLICFGVIMSAYKFSGHNLKSAYAAGVFMAIDIPTIVLANSILAETLFTFLLFLSILLFVFYLEKRKIVFLFISAILMSLSVLCRPIAFLLPGVLITALILRKGFAVRKRIFDTMLVLIMCFAVLSPWLIRNKIVFGNFFLSTISYDNLLYYQAAGVVAKQKKISISDAREELEQTVNKKFAKEPALNMSAQNSFKKKLAISIISSHPIIYFHNYVKSVFKMMVKPIRSDLDLMMGLKSEPSTLESWYVVSRGSLISEFFRKTSITTIVLCFFQMLSLAVLYMLSLMGVYKVYSKQFSKIQIFVPIIVYFCIMSGVPEVYARFRVPVMPFLAVLAGIGVLGLKKADG